MGENGRYEKFEKKVTIESLGFRPCKEKIGYKLF